jgi:hypothetical protein
MLSGEIPKGDPVTVDEPVLPIETPLETPPISKIDTDWAIANAARIEAEKKAKAAAGPTKEELRRAVHGAEIRAPRWILQVPGDQQYRAGGIRTHDLLNPIQAHYQAVLRPDDKELQDAAPKRRFQARKASIRGETIK